ncbi:MAG: hypothetical protein JOZ41_07735 [Chloroflexi bacterium]|nr:hypothetical protein [Chloroflexota bacterium]
MRTVFVVLFSLLFGALWLVLLEVSAFNNLVVGLGLIGVLTVSPKAARL